MTALIGPPLHREQHLEDGAQHHPRQEMRQVGDALHDALVAAVGQLVEDQREGDRRREAEGELEHADPEGVEQQLRELRRGEEELEVLEVVPGAAQDAGAGAVVLERDHHPDHGDVLEDRQQGQRDQKEQVQLSHADDAGSGLPAQRLSDGRVDRAGGRRTGRLVHGPMIESGSYPVKEAAPRRAYSPVMPEVPMVSTILLWLKMNTPIGTAMMNRVTTDAAPTRAMPPPATCDRAYGSGFNCSE